MPTERKSASRLPLIASSLGLLLILFATRAPQLTSEVVQIDGDEAVVGLMSLRLLDGEWPGLFFSGQNYGLSIVEACTGALIFLCCGVSSASLKAAMLLIFCCGCLVFGRGVRAWSTPRAGLIASLLLATQPAWGVWSMKARGGYLSALIVASAALWLMGSLARRRDASLSGMFGVLALMALTWICQPLWTPALLPFFVALLVLRRSKRDLVLVGAAAAGLVLLQMLNPSEFTVLNDFWSQVPEPDDRFALFLERLGTMFAGGYYLGKPMIPGRFALFSSRVWVTLLMVLPVIAGLLLVLRRRGGLLALMLLATAMLLPLVLLLGPAIFGYRYLLPVALFAAATLAVGLDRLAGRSRPRGLLALALLIPILGCGVAGLVEFRGRAFADLAIRRKIPEAQALDELYETCRDSGVDRIFAVEPMVAWKLMFRSEGEVLVRLGSEGRHPAYDDAVDRALEERGSLGLLAMAYQKGALLRLLGQAGPAAAGLQPQVVGHRYILVPDVPAEILGKLGYPR